MKKKILAMFLACSMIIPTCAYSVMAEDTASAEESTEAASEEATDAAAEETTEPVEINWEDLEPQIEEKGIEGDFITLGETGLKMWIPTSALTEVELTDDDVTAGYLAYYQNEDQTCTLSVQYADAEAVCALDDYITTVTEAGATEISYETINGLTAADFTFTENDSAGAAVETESGDTIVLGFTPASDEEFTAAVTIILASIQKDEDAASEDSSSEAASSEVSSSEESSSEEAE